MKQMLSVAGMRCSNCEVLVKEAIEELAGVSSAQASQREGSVTVEYDEQQVLLDTLKNTIAQQGFTVQGVLE